MLLLLLNIFNCYQIYYFYFKTTLTQVITRSIPIH